MSLETCFAILLSMVGILGLFGARKVKRKHAAPGKPTAKNPNAGGTRSH